MTTASLETTKARWVSLFHRPALLLLIGLSLPLGVLTLAVFAVAAASQPAAALTTIGLLAISVGVLVFAIVRLAPGMLSVPMALAAFGWGALVAPPFAALGNELWGSVFAALVTGGAAEPWSAALAAGPIEEAYKLLGVALVGLAWPAATLGAARGLAVGMLVGLGFGTVEHAGYLATFALLRSELGGPAEAVIWGFLARTLASGLYAHVAFTGISGAVLGWASAAPSIRRWLLVALGLASAAALHALANLGPVTQPLLPWAADQVPMVIAIGAVRSIPFIVVLAALVVLGRSGPRQERSGTRP